MLTGPTRKKGTASLLVCMYVCIYTSAAGYHTAVVHKHLTIGIAIVWSPRPTGLGIYIPIIACVALVSGCGSGCSSGCNIMVGISMPIF